MKIVDKGASASTVKGTDMEPGHVYHAEDSDVLFIMGDEGTAIDLDDGCQWSPDGDEQFVEVRGHFVLEG